MTTSAEKIAKPLRGQLFDRVSWEPFAGQRIPFLSCYDLVVFKAFFNRTSDWADLEEMRRAGTLNIEQDRQP